MSSANLSTLLDMSTSRSFIYFKNSIGPNTGLCGTPLKTDFQFEIVRLRCCLDSADVQLYSRVSCEDYITRFKEVCNKAIIFERSLCLCSRYDESQSHCQQRFMSIALSPRNVT